MLDERWSEEVEEIGGTLRKVLAKQCSSEQVRAAEASNDGLSPAVAEHLSAFGLDDLEAEPDLFARIAYELGHALAPTAYVETIPVLALTGRSNVALAFSGPVPASVAQVAVIRSQGVYLEALCGDARRTTAGDLLVEHQRGHVDGQWLGDSDLADRLSRYAALVDAARMTGAGQALLQYGLGYAKEREQFGKIIGSYQGVANRLANASVLLDAAELLVRKAAFTARADVGGDGAPSAAFAIMVRAKAIEAARSVATTVHQTFGGNGFAMEYDVQLYSRRLRSWANRGERPGERLADLARSMLDPGKRDQVRLLWHHDQGIPLPRWAREADKV
ncbi:acyl-CoA dehydrogenase family protein [Pseudomonas bharatica]|uniref:acyl-CoA dehydrogenase family protein n=1 Tax=Pseudomonas bharatica TaxID=2692112 RepID=UPI003B282F49